MTVLCTFDISCIHLCQDMNSPVAIATSHVLLTNTLCAVTMYIYMYVIVYRVINNIIGVTHYILMCCRMHVMCTVW